MLRQIGSKVCFQTTKAEKVGHVMHGAMEETYKVLERIRVIALFGKTSVLDPHPSRFGSLTNVWVYGKTQWDPNEYEVNWGP
jgi:hypothetical protein